jgi:polyhydroxyalkanoate synthesis regulator protein
MFSKVVEILVMVFLIWVICFQMFIPTYLNRKMFPMFRKESKLQDELVSLNTEEATVQLEEVVANRTEEVKTRAKRVRKQK